MSLLRRFLTVHFLTSLLLVGLVDCSWRYGSAGYFDGRSGAVEPLARTVAERALRLESEPFPSWTGSQHFDGEWHVGTCQMTVLGLSQLALEHPERRDDWLPGIRACSAWLADPVNQGFGTTAWGESGLESLDSDAGHAYLGYTNLALGMHRRVDPGFPHAELHDSLTAALARRIDASTLGTIESYPGESYPCDVSAVVGSIGLHGTVTGTDHSELLQRWRGRYLDTAVEPDTGLLIQATSSTDGRAFDDGRGSGTALAIYFLSFADPSLSEQLWQAYVESCWGQPFGFGAFREYPHGNPGSGDVDSGPVLLGWGVSATGFGIAGARIHGDRPRYRAMYRTAHFAGLPWRWRGHKRFVVGSDIGNAIMLAMFTAPTLGG